MGPMSTIPQPKSWRIAATFFFAPSSFPQRNMSGGPPGNCGRNMWALPTVLKALTTRAPSRSRWTRSPPESAPATASFGGKPPDMSRGFVVSMTTFPRNASTPARRRASSAATPRVARTTTSPKAAASEKFPSEARGPCDFAQALAFAFPERREPIFTSWPRVTNPCPIAFPTSPVPRMPIFMAPASRDPPRTAPRSRAAAVPPRKWIRRGRGSAPEQRRLGGEAGPEAREDQALPAVEGAAAQDLLEDEEHGGGGHVPVGPVDLRGGERRARRQARRGHRLLDDPAAPPGERPAGDRPDAQPLLRDQPVHGAPEER